IGLIAVLKSADDELLCGRLSRGVSAVFNLQMDFRNTHREDRRRKHGGKAWPGARDLTISPRRQRQSCGKGNQAVSVPDIRLISAQESSGEKANISKET